MNNLILNINEFINRADLEITDKIQERFELILNESIQQLKSFRAKNVREKKRKIRNLYIYIHINRIKLNDEDDDP